MVMVSRLGHLLEPISARSKRSLLALTLSHKELLLWVSFLILRFLIC